MYCRYLRFKITCTSPASLPSTFLFLVESKPQKPMAFIISCSSGVLPSRSASLTFGRCGADELLGPLVSARCRRDRFESRSLLWLRSLSNERDLQGDEHKKQRQFVLCHRMRFVRSRYCGWVVHTYRSFFSRRSRSRSGDRSLSRSRRWPSRSRDRFRTRCSRSRFFSRRFDDDGDGDRPIVCVLCSFFYLTYSIYDLTQSAIQQKRTCLLSAMREKNVCLHLNVSNSRQKQIYFFRIMAEQEMKVPKSANERKDMREFITFNG